MSKKSDALGTGAIAFNPLVDIFAVLLRCPDIQRKSDAGTERERGRRRAEREEREKGLKSCEADGCRATISKNRQHGFENLDYITSQPTCG